MHHSYQLCIYRYNPGADQAPYMQSLTVESKDIQGIMLLDLLKVAKEIEPSLAFRFSCGAGICGSDGMNINGRNGLACMTRLNTLPEKITLRPLPGMPVIRDLVVDLNLFYRQYHSVKPYLQAPVPKDGKEHRQSIADRRKLDGLYECILCACCSTSCPSYWWNSDQYLGPAVLMQAYRWIEDSRDEDTVNRMNYVDDAMKLYRCKSIMNCSNTCPKGLNPGGAIGKLKKKISEELH